MQATFTIGEVTDLTGIPTATLRVWESRHAFPAPARGASGRRRYSEADVEQVRRVAADRAAGLSLASSIERARSFAPVAGSIYAAVVRAHPHLQPRRLAKPAMLALTHALEDEMTSRAERPMLFGAFQRERFYRIEQPRWEVFAASARVACVFADFAQLRSPAPGATEIPLGPGDQLTREWAVVADAPRFSACLAGRQLAQRGAENQPAFEALWSVEPHVCATAVEACAAIASRSLAEPVSAPAAQPGLLNPVEQLRLATAIANRALERVG